MHASFSGRFRACTGRWRKMRETVLPPLPDRHFVALNAHGFHHPHDILAAVASVAVALAAFRAERADSIEAVVFHSAASPLPEGMGRMIRRAGLRLVQTPVAPNGTNLNRQVAMAREAGATLFYRADADDLVDPARLVRQAALMTRTGADISGGALLYTCGPQVRIVRPNQRPGCRDVLVNRAALHPSLCLRIAALDRAGIGYWPHRLEDKHLIGQALAAGLSIRNDVAIYGRYNHMAAARSGPGFAALNLWLNLSLILRTASWGLVPMAFVLFLASSLLPSQWLRRLRDGPGKGGSVPAHPVARPY